MALAVIAAGAGLMGWGLFAFFPSSRSGLPIASIRSANVFAQPHKWTCPIPGNFKEVDVPVALLCDYYEHGIEHAPPRDPSGVMQKRELFYAAPHDPFDLVESRATHSVADQQVMAELR